MGSDGMGNREKAQYLRGDSVYFETERLIIRPFSLRPKANARRSAANLQTAAGAFLLPAASGLSCDLPLKLLRKLSEHQ